MRKLKWGSESELRQETAGLFAPPLRERVSSVAARCIRVSKGGGTSMPYSLELTPYMQEPMDMIGSRRHREIVFVGPAQSGKTQGLLFGAIAYFGISDPSDAMVVQTSQDRARDWSRRECDRTLRHSPHLRDRLGTKPRDDNTYDKYFRDGTILSIGWPSISQLSGKAIRAMLLTDYDRMPEDVEGEGSPFSLARARTRTFLSAGCTVAESSPGYDLTPGRWEAKTGHEAPPARGIMSLYNLGDRRRWYWPCPDCGFYFEGGPGLSMVHIPEGESLMWRARNARLMCPHCGSLIDLDKTRKEMNARGVWVPDGCTVGGDGVVEGEPADGETVSYWLHGTAAAFQKLSVLVYNYLAAEQEYERTGSEELLRSTINVDQGAAYKPRSQGKEHKPGEMEARSETWPKRLVPEGVRYLTASVDVQKNRFVVQVEGWGERRERWMPIDRYNLRHSTRTDPATGKAATVDPSGYAEDWRMLVEEVARKVYPLEGRPGWFMPVLRVMVDAGGHDDVTLRAYEFWRWCRRQRLGRSIRLIRGDGRPSAQRIRTTFPDAERKDRKAKARGEIPITFINTNLFKDGLFADLSRVEPGEGYVHLAAWIGPWWYEELTAEQRTDKGWQKIAARNEAIDLACYNRAAMIDLGAERINWDRPPPWATPWDLNPFLVQREPPADSADSADSEDEGPQPQVVRTRETQQQRRPVRKVRRLVSRSPNVTR